MSSTNTTANSITIMNGRGPRAQFSMVPTTRTPVSFISAWSCTIALQIVRASVPACFTVVPGLSRATIPSAPSVRLASFAS
jgi:hypothetical protein